MSCSCLGLGPDENQPLTYQPFCPEQPTSSSFPFLSSTTTAPSSWTKYPPLGRTTVRLLAWVPSVLSEQGRMLHMPRSIWARKGRRTWRWI